ncbi:hypothetical protein GA0070609_6312 [Micromonospora echinaurantiaca]|uniref:Uncharacterized protein n=2 Tax=Micromonospora echinaurantiaca TaxID=47857 RepID=A0A1C5KBW4_9ACTN|nr:hypothetical protein GA0070609_6312 [Micromonospora echinaurantiaca]
MVDGTTDTYHEPMIEQSRRRVPVPVAVAAVAILLAATAILLGAMSSTGPSTVVGLVVGLLVLALAYGLWRGSGRARFWTTVFATAGAVYAVVPFTGLGVTTLLQIVVAALVVVLLLVPASSRRWFHDLPVTE